MNAEQLRLSQPRHIADWKTWGPYLAERNWGTVREDYSADGSAWTYFPHDHARSRAYRWNEDGLLGISDRRQLLCFALALWNTNDPILKERPFGLSGPEGNHGEDVKEYYYYIDSTPTHSYLKALYKYPHAAFPYNQLAQENARRGKDQPEFELIDTGIFDEDRYFDVQIEYAKADPEDILVRITISNRGPDAAPIWLLPTLWFRNTWSWGEAPLPPTPDALRNGSDEYHLLMPEKTAKPAIRLGADPNTLLAYHDALGEFCLRFDPPTSGPLASAPGSAGGSPARTPPSTRPLFTENETNFQRLFQTKNASPYVKDAFHRFFINNEHSAVNPTPTGTKAAIPYFFNIPAGKSVTVRLRLAHDASHASDSLGTNFDNIFDIRQKESDEFYDNIAPAGLSDDLKNIQRQAFAGLMWSKQFYNYDVRRWLAGDTAFPPPPVSRYHGRNHDWQHIANDSVLSMPDTWEYPWYAAWDLAFHTISLVLIDPDFAKRQLLLLLREWFMHPSGQLPAYEWAFSDVNPPVHAWAALRVFKIERHMTGKGDRLFLERVFQKLLINFTWWINRKDADGRNLFQGGFLGLDNIGLFDRSATLPGGTRLDQSDGTAWMAMFCLNMLAIALELASEDPAYEDVATKFLEHFFYIAHAMNDRPKTEIDDGVDLWDDVDHFYYDVLHKNDGESIFLKVRSAVGLIPLLAVETMEPRVLERLPDFARRLDWFLTNRPDLCKSIASVTRVGRSQRRLFSIVDSQRLRDILGYMLDESEFLSPHGLRGVSRFHEKNPAILDLDGTRYSVDYEPAESRTGLFGGNSNWRGPIWFPLNYLIIESLQKFDFYYGDDFQIECPTGSGNVLTLWEVATELSLRLMNIFRKNPNGTRPVFGTTQKFQNDPLWNNLIPFHEYFHGNTGAGLGASHQTGWTALIAKLIQQSGLSRKTKPTRK